MLPTRPSAAATPILGRLSRATPRWLRARALTGWLLVLLPGAATDALPARDVAVLAPTQDAFVTNAAPDASFGADPELYVGLQLDPKLGPRSFRALLQFDVAGALPPGAAIESAVLRLFQHATVSGGVSATQTVIALPVTSAWDQATVSWTSQPTVATSGTSQAPGLAEGYKEWDVTAIAEKWLTGELPQLGVSVRSSSETAIAGWVFRSKDAGTDPPELHVVYSAPAQPTPFRRGDANGDGRTDLGDAVHLLLFLFAHGRAPPCWKAGDASDDGAIDLADPIRILVALFLGKGPLPEPSTACGPDPTPDDLGCALSAPCSPATGLIRSVTLEKTVVCPGESFRVTVLAEHPGAAGQTVEVAIQQRPGSEQQLQLTGPPGERRLSIAAWTADGLLETRTVVVRVATCGAAPFPILRARPSPFDPRAIDLVVANAAELGPGPLRFKWEPGDGATVETDLPTTSHRYALTSFRRDEPYTLFDVRVLVQPSAGPELSATRTLSLLNPYALDKQRGFIVPPAESEARMRRRGPDLVGAYTLVNLEDEGIVFTRRVIEVEPCEPDQPPRPLEGLPGDAELGLSLYPRERLSSAISVPRALVPPDACRLAVRLEGTTDSGVPAAAGLYFEVRQSPALSGPETDYDILRVLNAATAAALVPDPDRVRDEELDRLALEARIEYPLRGRIQIPGGGGGIGDADAGVGRGVGRSPGQGAGEVGEEIGDECLPGARLPPGLSCQSTPDWTVARGYVANARKGELVLVRSCNPVSRMLQRIGQTFSHVGIMTRHNVELTHSTVSDERYIDYPAEDDFGGDPTDGIDTDVLRHGWPGAIVQLADDAFRGTWRDDPQGREYSIHSFSWQPQACDFDGALVAPQVLKAAPGREAEVAAPLDLAAEAARSIALGDGAHYRLYAYTDGAIALDDAWDGPLAGLRDASCCSTFIWEAFQRAGPVELEGAREEGEVGTPGTPDGLYYYDAETRRVAADMMYDAIYDMAYAEGGWAGVLFADAPDDLANQICNCFASDDCGQHALDSTAWQDPGPGTTVSPDDTLGWDRLYGPHEDVIYRAAQWVRVYRVARSAGAGAIAGRVLDEDGAPAADALVELVSLPEVAPARSDAAGLFQFDAVPSGAHSLRATKLMGGLLHETCEPGAEGPAGDCALVRVEANHTASTTLRLAPPWRNVRVVTIHGQGRIRDAEVIRDIVRDRELHSETQLTPFEREAHLVIEPACVGGEVRFKLILDLELLEDDLTVAITGIAELHEAESCELSDIDDSADLDLTLGEGACRSLHIDLENRGFDGGDTARFDLDFVNTTASWTPEQGGCAGG